MADRTPSLSNRGTGCASAVLVILALAFVVGVTPSHAQGTQQWTERENFGLKGPVRSVRITVARPNTDPRPPTGRKLFIQGGPDWEAFDIEGRRIEYASASTPEAVTAITKCAFQTDGSRVCTDSAGRQQESKEQRTILPDGSREVMYFAGSRVVGRDVTQVDKTGKPVAFRAYHDGKLSSEESTLPNGDEEWKIYDESGGAVSDLRTRVSDDKNRIDRWSYDSEGHLVWNLAINSDGELLSYWYDIGFKPKVSSSDSLGMCRPRLCVDYKFDENGSGRLERTVQHTPGNGNLEPDSEEHYDFNGILDEKVEIKYVRDGHGNWTSRSVFVWDPNSNIMIEVERDTRVIEYY